MGSGETTGFASRGYGWLLQYGTAGSGEVLSSRPTLFQAHDHLGSGSHSAGVSEKVRPITTMMTANQARMDICCFVQACLSGYSTSLVFNRACGLKIQLVS